MLRKLDALAVQEQADPRQWVQALVPGEPSVVVPASLADFPEMAEIPELARPSPGRRPADPVAGPLRGDHLGPPVRPGLGRAARQLRRHPRRHLGRGRAAGRAPRHDRAERATRTAGLARLPPARRPSPRLRPPHLTAIALHVAAPILRGVAEELESDSRLEPPPSVTVSLLGHRVELRPEGPDEESLAVAEAAISAAVLAPPRAPWAPGLLVLGGLTCLVAAFLTHPVTAAAGVVLFALAGWLLWQRRERVLSDAAYVAAQVSELRELADGAVWALHAYAREAEGRAKQAAEDATDITRLIRRGPRAA
ncbi:hypothetical protein ACFSTC_01805 [Nonomuraea ferruginea]